MDVVEDEECKYLAVGASICRRMDQREGERERCYTMRRGI